MEWLILYLVIFCPFLVFVCGVLGVYDGDEYDYNEMVRALLVALVWPIIACLLIGCIAARIAYRLGGDG